METSEQYITFFIQISEEKNIDGNAIAPPEFGIGTRIGKLLSLSILPKRERHYCFLFST